MLFYWLIVCCPDAFPTLLNCFFLPLFVRLACSTPILMVAFLVVYLPFFASTFHNDVWAMPTTSMGRMSYIAVMLPKYQ